MMDDFPESIADELDSGMLESLPPLPPDPTKTRWTVAELLAAEFTEPRWIVPGKIPAGCSFLGGRPKLGKSWFMQQVSYTVGIGGMMFDVSVPRGKVLYL